MQVYYQNKNQHKNHKSAAVLVEKHASSGLPMAGEHPKQNMI